MADHGWLVRSLLGLALVAALLAVVPRPADAAPPPATAATEASTFRVDDETPAVGVVGDHLVARVTDVDPFTTIGVTSSGSRGRVRAHLDSGWTRWFALHVEDGPTSEPIWVGDDADGYELRLPGGTTDVVVHLVRPTGVRAPVAAAPAESAERAFNTAPPIRRREAWGAAPYRGTPRMNARITRGVVHHTVNTNSYGQSQVPSMLRSIQAFHQGTRGWPDIAYNFIVDRFGTIWEARDRSYEDPVQVSATSGTDRDTVTVSFLGDGSSYTPSSATLQAMGRLLGWKMRKHGILPTRGNIVGHTQIGQTSCPGAALLAKVPTIENAAMAGNPPPGPYWDVPWTSRNAKAIVWSRDKAIIPGFADHTFRPTSSATRADTVVWVWRMAGRPAGSSQPFTDVPANAPYREALEWGSDTGVVKGISPTRFGPGRPMTRLGMIDMLWRWQGAPEVPVPHHFSDEAPRDSLDWAAEARVVGGPTFGGSDPTTRAKAASFLYDLRPFTDVGRGNLARAATEWARAHVIVTGFGGHTFRPGTNVTRASAAEWVWRFLDRPAPGPVDAAPGANPLNRATAVTWLYEAAGVPVVVTPSDYTDVDSGDAYEAAAAWSQDFALFPDIADDTFGATHAVTRAQLVRALFRLADRPTAWAVTPPSTVRF
jgi:hypothetical protein